MMCVIICCSDFESFRWGPNHAADPIVTRWQREEDGQVVSDKETGKQVEWVWSQFDIQVAVAVQQL